MGLTWLGHEFMCVGWMSIRGNNVSGPNWVSYLTWTPILEWCGSKNKYYKYMWLKKIVTMCSNALAIQGSIAIIHDSD